MVKKNIAIMINSLVAGGAERAAITLGEYLCRQGHSVFYFLFTDNRKPFFKVEGRIVKTYIFFPFSSDLSQKENIRELFFSAYSLYQLKRKYQIDISISFMEAWNFLNACSKCKDKLIFSVRTVISERTEYSGLLYDPVWIKRLYNRADSVVAVSEYVKEDLIRKYGIKRKITTAIPNVSRTYPLINNYREWTDGDKAIVTIGRMDIVKQQERIIRAFSEIIKMNKDARLIIVGDGKQMGYLRKVRHNLGLDDYVKLPGTESDIGFYLKNARGFVLASRVEGFPNVIAEAMAYGVPIITTDSPGGCGEIVGKETSSDELQFCKYGILTPYIKGNATIGEEISREEKILGEAMSRIIQDNDLYRKYADMSLKRANDYSEENIMCKWEKVCGLKD